LLAVRDFLEQLSSKKETVDEAALDEELRQVRLTNLGPHFQKFLGIS